MESLQIRAIKTQYIVFTIITNTISSIIVLVNLHQSSVFEGLAYIFLFLLSPFLSSTYCTNLIQPIAGRITTFLHSLLKTQSYYPEIAIGIVCFFLNLHNSGNPKKEGNVINFNVLQPKLGRFRDPYQLFNPRKYLFILAWLDLFKKQDFSRLYMRKHLYAFTFFFLKKSIKKGKLDSLQIKEKNLLKKK